MAIKSSVPREASVITREREGWGRRVVDLGRHPAINFVGSDGKRVAVDGARISGLNFFGTRINFGEEIGDELRVAVGENPQESDDLARYSIYISTRRTGAKLVIKPQVTKSEWGHIGSTLVDQYLIATKFNRGDPGVLIVSTDPNGTKPYHVLDNDRGGYQLGDGATISLRVVDGKRVVVIDPRRD